MANNTGRTYLASILALGLFIHELTQPMAVLCEPDATALVDLLAQDKRSKVSVYNLHYWPGKSDLAHTINYFIPRKPNATGAYPLIIYVHGGGWTTRPSAQPTWITQAADRGIAVATVYYRLGQEADGHYPAQIEDLDAALAYIHENAAKMGIDPDRLGLWGTSAGGHLVILLALIGKNTKGIKAVCDFCGPADLVELGNRTLPGMSWDTSSANSGLAMLLGKPANEAPQLAREASPVSHIHKDAHYPAFLIVHGQKDNVVPFDQSVRLYNAFKEKGPAQMQVEMVTPPRDKHYLERGKNIGLALDFFSKNICLSCPGKII